MGYRRGAGDIGRAIIIGETLRQVNSSGSAASADMTVNIVVPVWGNLEVTRIIKG